MRLAMTAAIAAQADLAALLWEKGTGRGTSPAVSSGVHQLQEAGQPVVCSSCK